MSNRLFQSVVHQMKDAVESTIGVIDTEGVIIACSDLVRIGETISGVKEELFYTGEAFYAGGYTFRPIGAFGKTEYYVFVQGEGQNANFASNLLCISLGQIKALYDEKYDKTSFIKNIILDNILPSDIYVKSKELHLSNELERVAFLIKFGQKLDIVPVDVIQNMFPDRNRDYVISVGESDVVLIHELHTAQDKAQVTKLAKSIVDTIQSEFYLKVVVGMGTVASSLKELARSYKEAQVAIEVGKVFDTEKSVVNYENLGIGRLIYQLPSTLCDMFLNEVFKKGALESLDRETLLTIQCFFENNLNVSETSRKLFVHRNTLVYRLEKIRKITGLDLREFEHAITFKVALMVKKYLSSKPGKF
ncbi:MAG: PucR family transcriptional regulator [Ruminococcaceae bacterium]|nr:PucR family transcriptional regulator [Oscillospiraceae bacterium]